MVTARVKNIQIEVKKVKNELIDFKTEEMQHTGDAGWW